MFATLEGILFTITRATISQVRGNNMALVTRGNAVSATNKAMDAGVVIGSAVGGIAGFFAADTIGFQAIVTKIWSTTGVQSLAPGLANVETLVTALVAAGIYIAVGVVVMRLNFDGKVLKIVTHAAGWFFCGCGIRELFTGLTSGVSALKTVGK